MPCPNPVCKAEDRLCVKNGFVYRKTTVGEAGRLGAKVQRYLCTQCGTMGRGNLFKLPEFPGQVVEPLEEASEEPQKTLPEQKKRVLQAKVTEITHEDNRTVLWISPDYHVVASKTGEDINKISVGDTIKYEPEGVNFGWLHHDN